VCFNALIRFRFIGARGAFIRRLPFGVEGGFRPGHMRVCALTLTSFLHTMIFAYCGYFLYTPPCATLLPVAGTPTIRVFINSTQNEKTAALCNTRYPRKTKMQKKAKKAKRTIAGFEPVCPIPLCV
jgi:hypothetical protein